MSFINFVFLMSLVTQVAMAVSAKPELPWFHQNLGQSIRYDITAVSSEAITGRPGLDTGLQTFIPVDEGAKADIIVAVLDSGADISHPFLRDALVKGDSREWDFTVSSSERTKPLLDQVGHGTHTAGIIASFAAYSNVAIFKRIKVLPLKVVGSQSSQRRSLTASISEALDYAYQHGAKVVNLSLNWPRAQNDDLESAIKLAESRGMILVAAAGNTHTDTAQIPCSYQGVICVGAIRNDGKLADFSNFGAAVDFVAPGANIISSIPQHQAPVFTNVQGFDAKSGTSQASPIIAAYAALVLSQNPALSRDAVYARLVAAASERMGVPVLNGFPRLSQLLNSPGPATAKPEFKGSSLLLVENNKAFLPLTLVNFGARAKHFVARYRMSAENRGLSLDRISDVVEFKDGEARKQLLIPISVEDPDAESFLRLWVRLEDGAEEDYLVTTQLATAFSPERGKLSHLDLPRDTEFASAQRVAPRSNSYIVASNRNSSGTTIRLIQVSPSDAELLGTIHLPSDEQPAWNTAEGMGLGAWAGAPLVADLNGDGKDDLLFVVKRGDHFKVYYLNLDLTPLFSFGAIDFKTEANWEPLDGKAQLLTVVSSFGEIAVPVLRAMGPISAVDFQTKRFDFVANPVRANVYWLEPRIVANGSVELVTRTLFNPSSTSQLFKKLEMPNGVATKPIAVVAKGRELQILAELELTTGEKLFQLLRGKSTEQESIEWGETNSIAIHRSSLSDGMVQEISSGRGSPTNSWIFVSAPKANQISLYKIDGGLSEHLGEVDVRAGAKITDFTSASLFGGESQSFVQTSDSIILYRQGRTAISHPIVRVSYLIGQMASSVYQPVYVRGGAPALYSDQTPLNASNVYVLKETKQGLVAPVRLSFAIPRDCTTLNPQLDTTEQSDRLLMACRGPSGITFYSRLLE